MPRENRPAAEPTLAQAVQACADSPAFLEAVAAVYRQADSAVKATAAARDSSASAAGGAICMGGGSCCRFDLMGHRLYVSTGELACLRQGALPPGVRVVPLRCPYQLGPRCSARDVRPLGCRVFFCDRPSAEAFQRIYEEFHRCLRHLHEEHHLPYRYVELSSALAELSL